MVTGQISPAGGRRADAHDGRVRGLLAPRPRGAVLRRAVVRVAVVAEWYPSPGDPVLGIWAHRQAMAARDAGAEVRVLALRRPIPPLSVARSLVQIPPAIGALSRWIEGARTSLRPWSLDGLSVEPVPFVAPPRPTSYGSWGYWMAPSLRRALDRLYAEWRFDVLHAHCLAPAGHAAARWVRGRRGPAFVVSAHGPDMINVPDDSSSGGARASRPWRSAEQRVREQHLGGAAMRGDRGAVAAGARALPRCRPARLRPGAHANGTVPDGHGGASGRAQAPRGRAARAGCMLDPARRPEYLVIGDGPCQAGTGASGGRTWGRGPRPVPRPADKSRGGCSCGCVRSVRDAGRRGAVRRGVRRGDGGRAAGDRQPRRGRTRGHRGRRSRDGAGRARRPGRAGRADRPADPDRAELAGSAWRRVRRWRRTSRGSGAGSRRSRRTGRRSIRRRRQAPPKISQIRDRSTPGVARHHPRAAAGRRAARRHAARGRRFGGRGVRRGSG